ncbi:MAG: Zeta toxin [Flavobacteriaceae bacterium]|nr:MAG: Zeta toxin [Flavobacteriaceae bacterium]
MIHLIVGNTGAGKTTYSQNLKKSTQGIIFSIDTWNNTLFMPDKTDSDGLDWFLERIERAETLIQQICLQLNDSGMDAILDLGLSKYEHREKFRQFALKNNISLQLHFLDVAKNIRKNRISQRNIEKGNTFEFEVSDANFEFMETWFEKPSDRELEQAIITTS